MHPWIILYKTYDKSQHHLVQSDLDSTDQMNYQLVFNIVYLYILKIPKKYFWASTDASRKLLTIEFWIYWERWAKLREQLRSWNLLKVSWEPMFIYIYTPVIDCIFYGVYCVQFLRIWRQWLYKNKVPASHFVTPNSWEGLEINLVWLLKLAKESKAQDLAQLWSQKCESLFRTIRSFTGVQSTIVNCSLKDIFSRIHKIELCEKLKDDLKEEIFFPEHKQESKRIRNEKVSLNQDDIENAIECAMIAATERETELGMSCDDIKLERFLKVPKQN